MRSFISWLDHSEEEQRRVREVMALFSSSDTVDDLGIGTIRDAMSNALFPGTSVVQTRARYLLFVPWIYRQAASQQPGQLVAKAGDMERKLIMALKAGGDEEGLIGGQAGVNVKRLPSSVYWAGLQRFGIFTQAGMSIGQYGRLAGRVDVPLHEQDELAERKRSFWCWELPEPPTDFFKFRAADFRLAGQEAEWLCEKIASTEVGLSGPNLLARFVADLRRGHDAPDATSLWDAARPVDTPERLDVLVAQAQHFSLAIRGAALLYNLVLADARAPHTEPNGSADTSPDIYRAELDTWAKDSSLEACRAWALQPSSLWDALKEFDARVPVRTTQFVERWLAVLRDDPMGIADNENARAVVADREREHKRAQARLVNHSRLMEWRGQSGTARLEFRWPLVKRLLTDLHAGLGRQETHAVA